MTTLFTLVGALRSIFFLAAERTAFLGAVVDFMAFLLWLSGAGKQLYLHNRNPRGKHDNRLPEIVVAQVPMRIHPGPFMEELRPFGHESPPPTPCKETPPRHARLEKVVPIVGFSTRIGKLYLSQGPETVC